MRIVGMIEMGTVCSVVRLVVGRAGRLAVAQEPGCKYNAYNKRDIHENFAGGDIV